MNAAALPRIFVAISILSLAALLFVSLNRGNLAGNIGHHLKPNSRAEPLGRADPTDYPNIGRYVGCSTLELHSAQGFESRGFPPNPSSSCLVLEEPGLILVRAQHTSRFGSMPLLLVAPTRNLQPERAIVILVGGPRDNIFSSLNDDLLVFLRELARQGGRTILVPAYYGTAHRSVYPESDLDFASVELTQWMENLRQRGDVNQVYVVGFSAGALLAYDIFRDRPWPTVLVSPPAVSIEDLYRMRQVPFLYGTARARSERSGAVSYEMRNGRMVFADLREAPLADISRAFFGRHYGQRTWTSEITQMAAAQRRCLGVIFGEHDRSVASEVFFRENLHRQVRTEEVPGMGHMPRNETQARALALRIAELQSCE